MSCSQVIQCGSGYSAYQTNGEAHYYVCNNMTKNAQFKPSLPSGLTLVESVIEGKPKRSFSDLRIQIKDGSLYGDWFITCYCSFGFLIIS